MRAGSRRDDGQPAEGVRLDLAGASPQAPPHPTCRAEKEVRPLGVNGHD